MDLSTTYLGFALPNPLMPGASPLSDSLDAVRRLEDAGAAAIVLRSLFEEQIASAESATGRALPVHGPEKNEAASYFPRPDDFVFRPDDYLEHVRRIKASVAVPVIGSLNGTTRAGWLRYAELLEEAGVDAIELNLYYIPTDPLETGADVERRLLDAARQLRRSVSVPIAVKLSPFFSSLASVAAQLDLLGVNGLVLFNRFLQPDIDLEMMVAAPRLRLSSPDELLLRVRWLAILHGRLQASLAVTGGVQTGIDALKAVMAGASAVQVVTALLTHGPEYLVTMRRELARWLEMHDYESLGDAHGCMSLLRSADAALFERGSYMRILHSWSPKARSVLS